ncbi:MAG: hypothetical protein Q4E70_00560 [Candidatus Saccharibacteria bacterium]|nr:hypothetical protein [Candidatus Saccharibacteria bacterium]
MKENKSKEILSLKKRGVASMFVVVFTIIILGIVVLSFTRLIISEAIKTTNTDLSQSAYDSALAGVEDAKIALLRYHDCLDRGATATSGSVECRDIIKKMQDGINNNDCSTVQKVLNREQAAENNAVVVQETQNSTDSGNNANMLQAYTCVTIKEDLDDYRTTLGSASAGRLRIIPIRADNIDAVDTVQIKWFSSVNASKLVSSGGSIRYCGNNRSGSTLLLYPNGQCNGSFQGPPTLAVRLIQTDATFNLSELSVSKDSDKTDTGELIFVPTNSGGTNSVGASAWGESANKGTNLPIQISCSAGTWYCSATVSLPKTFRGLTNRNDANTYLLVSLPYGTPETDISVTASGVVSGAREQIEFSGVQARIDSTGRANDLYRRVETRVELVDTYFAYPEYEITMTDAHSNIYKTFYATFDCFRSDRGFGTVGNCNNTEEDDMLDSFH